MASYYPRETGSSSEDALGFQRLMRLVVSHSPHASTASRATLLLPLVRRALETGRGPSCLVDWLEQSKASAHRRESGDQLARALSEELAESLAGPGDRRAETVRGL
jgi:hypothetical protein